MNEPKISVGVDTPSGEPRNGPTGPYITEESDGTDIVPPVPTPAPSDKAPSRTETEISRNSELGSDRAGG
ncbi:MAG TPA: hypothetical protein VNQ99_07260 [Xanthobacteraceae bacterium]|nr:hypothetical protein [Xanthobacteraceae bacterium]